MREYERLRTEGKLSELVASQSAARDKLIKDDVTTSSAGDVGSESSISDVQVSHVFVVGSKGGKKWDLASNKYDPGVILGSDAM